MKKQEVVKKLLKVFADNLTYHQAKYKIEKIVDRLMETKGVQER